MAEIERIPLPGATNDQIAKGVNDLHQCIEEMREDIDNIKALPGKMVRWVLLTGAGILMSQAITFFQNQANHEDLTRRQDVAVAVAAKAADTSTDTNQKVTKALGE